MWKKVYNLIRNKYFLSLAGNFIMSGLGLITSAFIYRYLSKPDASVWVFFQLVLLLVDTVRSGFLTTAFIKFYAGATADRKKEIAGSAWFIGGAITLLLAGVSAASLPFLSYMHNEGVQLFFKWSGVYYLVSLPWFLATCVIQGEQLFGKLLYIRLCNQGSFILFIILLILTGHATLLNVLAAYLLANAITSVYALFSSLTLIRTIGMRTKGCISEIYHFGKYSVGSALSANMFGFSDSFIIYFLFPTASGLLAVYNVGQSLMQVVEIPLRSFAATAMPELSEAYNKGERTVVIDIMKKYAGLLSVLLIPAAIIGALLADVPIYIVGGHKYVGTEAANVFRLFLTFAILFPPERFFALTLDVIHRPKVNFYKVLVMLAVNIITDFIGLSITHNVYGIAFATICPVLTGTIIGYYALNQYSSFTYWGIFKVGYYESIAFIKNMLFKGRVATDL